MTQGIVFFGHDERKVRETQDAWDRRTDEQARRFSADCMPELTHSRSSIMCGFSADCSSRNHTRENERGYARKCTYAHMRTYKSACVHLLRMRTVPVREIDHTLHEAPSRIECELGVAVVAKRPLLGTPEWGMPKRWLKGDEREPKQ